MPPRVIVLGAGPIGIAAALGALERGFDTTLIESADRAGASLRRWGSTRFFTPLTMNVTPLMTRLLPGDLDPEARFSGQEYAERILDPIARHAHLRERLVLGLRVTEIGRRGMTRSDYPGHPLRAERPFRLIGTHDGRRVELECDVVLDATGVGIPMAFGTGGLTAAGEPESDAIRHLGDLLQRIPGLSGREIAVVGHGHSAANAIGALMAVPDIRVTWIVRTSRHRPCEEVANDPLPERTAISQTANDYAAAPPTRLRVERRSTVSSIRRDGERWVLGLSRGQEIVVDAVAAFTGYRPDPSPYGELALDLSPVTEGTGRLYRALSNVTDCLAVPEVSERDLGSGEPGFFMIGARAYGRSRTFLLQTGFRQVDTILDSLQR